MKKLNFYPNHELLILTEILNVIPHFKYTQQFTIEALQPRLTLTTIYKHCRSPSRLTTNAPHDFTQPSDPPTVKYLPQSIDDLLLSDFHIAQETTDGLSQPPPQGSRGHNEGQKFPVHLSKLEIPAFTGEPLDW